MEPRHASRADATSVSQGRSSPRGRKRSVSRREAARLRCATVGDTRPVRCRVAAYAVNQDGNTMKLRPRLMGSEHSSRPELLVPEVRHVRLTGFRCYEDPVLVHQHDYPPRLRAATRLRTTVASSLCGLRWPLSSIVGTEPQKPSATSAASTRTTARLRTEARQSKRPIVHFRSGRKVSPRTCGGTKVEYSALGPSRSRSTSAPSRRPDRAIR